jgi:nucleotide-binding universal stress UspA family protein
MDMIEAPRVVVVGMDYSPLAEAALHRALRLTEESPHATIHAVTVAERAGKNVRLPDGTVLSQWAALDAVRVQLAERVKQWPNAGPANLRVVGHVRGGNPAKALLDMTFRTGASCIVVGAHSGSPREIHRVGGVARQVLDQAKVEVHLESPITQMPRDRHDFDPLRFAYVFGTGRRKTRDELALRSLGFSP